MTSTASESILRHLRRRGGALFIRRSIQIDYSNAAFTVTLALPGPRPAAESALLVSAMSLRVGCLKSFDDDVKS